MKNPIFRIFAGTLEFIYRKVIIYVPFAIIIFIGFDFSYKIITDPFAKELGERLIAGFKVSASLAAVSFYAGYMTTDNIKKPIFYKNGERLFHAAVLLIVAKLINRFFLTSETLQINSYFSSTIEILFVFLHIVFIAYALICAAFGLTGLLKILHTETEKLFKKNDA